MKDSRALMRTSDVMTEIIPKHIISEALSLIKFNSDGLVPAIAQQHDTGENLMLAWMNKESVAETLTSGQVCYWSRSRGKLWRKGETSGQIQNSPSYVLIVMVTRYFSSWTKKELLVIPAERTAFSQLFGVMV